MASPSTMCLQEASTKNEHDRVGKNEIKIPNEARRSFIGFVRTFTLLTISEVELEPAIKRQLDGASCSGVPLSALPNAQSFSYNFQFKICFSLPLLVHLSCLRCISKTSPAE